MVLTWVQPAEGSSWSHYVSSSAYKVSSISNNDTVFHQELINTMQDTQRIQMPLHLLMGLISTRGKHYIIQKIRLTVLASENNTHRMSTSFTLPPTIVA